MPSRTEVKIDSFADSYDFIENLIIPKYFDNMDKLGLKLGEMNYLFHNSNRFHLNSIH